MTLSEIAKDTSGLLAALNPLASIPKIDRKYVYSLAEIEFLKFSKTERLLLKDLVVLIEREIRASAVATLDDLTKVANRRGFDHYSFVSCHSQQLCCTRHHVRGRQTGTHV